ncbi:MAG: YggS family pyridoxal phosphate-dependent enzyme [Candidatus Omnitrophica bacterium]|nr:YggS family pyridoxal phosphate-dependent enzyme [Candidatus Omnitrophota bacterium]
MGGAGHRHDGDHQPQRAHPAADRPRPPGRVGTGDRRAGAGHPRLHQWRAEAIPPIRRPPHQPHPHHPHRVFLKPYQISKRHLISDIARARVATVLADCLQSVRDRIAKACQRSGRSPSAVTLIGVTKTVPVERIEEAVTAGLTDLGENRVQEARAKHVVLSRFQLPASSFQRNVRWHMIGHLQSNKARQAVEIFDVMHSVDSLPLIEVLEREAAKQSKAVDVLIQVNVSGEAAKSGCRPDETQGLAQALMNTSHLKLTGLMTIPPLADSPEASRPFFRQLRELRDTLQRGPLGHSATRPLQLSMGMSHDFEVAIEEGADVVRIGTAIFGARAT